MGKRTTADQSGFPPRPIRTVTLRNLAGTIHLIPFGEVTTVTNYNRDYGYALVDVGVAFRERYGDVVQALQDMASELRRDETWGPYITGELEVFGVNNLNLSDSAMEIRVRIKTLPMQQFAVRRAFLENMKQVFDERGINIPFPHRTIWFGTDKDGSAPPMYLAKTDRMDIIEASTASGPVAESKVRIASESEASEDVVHEMEQKPGSGKHQKSRSPEGSPDTKRTQEG